MEILPAAIEASLEQRVVVHLLARALYRTLPTQTSNVPGSLTRGAFGQVEASESDLGQVMQLRFVKHLLESLRTFEANARANGFLPGQERQPKLAGESGPGITQSSK